MYNIRFFIGKRGNLLPIDEVESQKLNPKAYIKVLEHGGIIYKTENPNIAGLSLNTTEKVTNFGNVGITNIDAPYPVKRTNPLVFMQLYDFKRFFTYDPNTLNMLSSIRYNCEPVKIFSANLLAVSNLIAHCDAYFFKTLPMRQYIESLPFVQHDGNLFSPTQAFLTHLADLRLDATIRENLISSLTELNTETLLIRDEGFDFHNEFSLYLRKF